MPVNFGLMNAIQPSKVIAELPSSGGGGGGDGGIGELLSGFSSLIKGVGGVGGGATNSNPQPYTNPGQTYGSNTTQPTMQQQSVYKAAPNISPNNSSLNLNQQVFSQAMKMRGLREGDPTLTAYLQKANSNLDPRYTPWCAGFVGSVLNASGLRGTGSLAAKSYLNYGSPVQSPTMGDIAVLNRTNDPSLGHVGFVQSVDTQKGIVNILGGNQGNSVSVKSFPLSQVAGFRRPPTGQEIQQFAQQNKIQSPQQLAQLTKPSQMTAGPTQPQQMPQFNNNEGSKIPQSISSMRNQQPQNSSINQSMDLLRGFEGFSPKTYWDVNAHRLGYGTDTITTPEGKIQRVKQGMTVSREDAERDLARRAQEFQNTASKQIGDTWGQLTPNAQAALTSVAYNYGSLPKSVVKAAQTGDLNAVADAVRGLGSHNKGVNRNRRNKEADYILNGAPVSPQSSDPNTINSPTSMPIPTFSGNPQPMVRYAANVPNRDVPVTPYRPGEPIGGHTNSLMRQWEDANPQIYDPSQNSKYRPIASNIQGTGVNWQLLNALYQQQNQQG